MKKKSVLESRNQKQSAPIVTYACGYVSSSDLSSLGMFAGPFLTLDSALEETPKEQNRLAVIVMFADDSGRTKEEVVRFFDWLAGDGRGAWVESKPKVNRPLSSLDPSVIKELSDTFTEVEKLQQQRDSAEDKRKQLTHYAYNLIRANGIDKVDSPDWILLNPGGGRTDLDEQKLLQREILCIHCGEGTHVSTKDLEACRVEKRWDSPQFKRKGSKEKK